MVRKLIFVILAIVVLFAVTPVAAQSTSLLHVERNQIVDVTGKQFTLAGINLEVFRDYTNGCGWATDGMIDTLPLWVNQFKSWNINIVRMNYNQKNMSAANRAKFISVAQALTKEGIFVMYSDHAITGNKMNTVPANSYTVFAQLWTDSATFSDKVIFNPFNEPGPDDTNPQWVQGQKNVLDKIRGMGFTGIVMLDGKGWATMADATSFNAVVAYDAQLIGKANVGFSSHLYPNINGEFVGTKLTDNSVWNSSKTFATIIGELGHENPGASSLDDNYVKAQINNGLTYKVPEFAWIANWCDTNKMFFDWQEGGSDSVPYKSPLVPSSHGNLWLTNYYSKIAVVTPPPAATDVAPTATKVRTNTPIPTATGTRRPTNTPIPTSTGTQQPTATVPVCPDGYTPVSVSVNGQVIILCGVLQ